MDFATNHNTLLMSGFDTTSGGFNGDLSQQRQPLRLTLTPVTIKQINDSVQETADGEFRVGPLELNMVLFVAVIRDVVDNTLNVVLQIEDGTGLMEIRKWADDSEHAAPDFHTKNRYAFFTGALKEFNGKKNLQHATIREITDHNEVLYHTLEAIKTHVDAKRGSSSGSGSNGPANLLFALAPAASEGGSTADRVHEFITKRSATMAEGVPVQLIATSLGLSEQVVRAACESLTEEGRVYQGYDDNGYLSI